MQTKAANEWLDIAPEIQAALLAGKAVVALESTIICHGMPHPRNLETALSVEHEVRENGAIPATIAILDGRLVVGLNYQQINYLAEQGKEVVKTSRRDIPFLVARQQDGATTVAATMIIAAMAGIRVFATGGIGGVHRGVESTLDISADLEELSRTNVAVVCAGIKSVLDIGRTLEYLETRGVPVVGYQTNTLPAFYTRASNFTVDYRVDSAEEVAAAMHAKWAMGIDGGLIIANPVPVEFSMNPYDIEKLIADSIEQMNRVGVTGRDTTPFLLSRIAEQTAGNSLDTNVALVLNNARIAAQIACAFCEPATRA